MIWQIDEDIMQVLFHRLHKVDINVKDNIKRSTSPNLVMNNAYSSIRSDLSDHIQKNSFREFIK